MSHKLTRLLNAKSVALFGGSWAENVIVQLQKSGFTGDIWPVHPKRTEICGIACIPDVSELPGVPDASFIGVNRDLTIDVVTSLSKMGAGGAICFASGFLESEAEGTGGAELQDRLIEAAGDMPILGPNCYGLLNYLDNVTLWPDQHGGRPVKSGVALIAQSSNVLINMTMQKRSLPVAYAIAAGNQAQTGLSEIASTLIDDDRVTAIGFYIEGFGDLRAFEEMAEKARAAGKPLVAIKTGKSEKSQIATMTHTASLAGGSAASSALLKRLGITEVDSVGVFLETLKLLHAFGPLQGNEISSMSCSGGEASMIADMAEGTDLNFRDFSPQQYKALKEVLGPIVTVANPLDYHTFIWGDEEKLTDCYSAALADNFDLGILIMDIPAEDRCDTAAWQGPLRAIKQAKKNTNANVALLATLPENLPEQLGDELMSLGIVPLHGFEEMIHAVNAAIRSGIVIREAKDKEPFVISKADDANSHTLSEADSKSELVGFGLKVPYSISVSSPEEISTIASKLKFPVVLKGLGIAHKSEAGAVVLNLQDHEALVSAAHEMAARTNGQCSRYLIEEMVKASVCELLVGVTRDVTGLMLLTIGAGGVLTELLKDSTSVLLPASRAEIKDAVLSLRIAPLLHGFRGKPGADIEAVLDAIEAIGNYAVTNKDYLIELDVNPLLALEDSAIAVDALIRRT